MQHRGWLTFALVAGAAATAHADEPAADGERIMFATVHGSAGAGGPRDSAYTNEWGNSGPADGILQLRGVVSWEQAPLPYREPRGYNWRGLIVPEIILGSLWREGDGTDYTGSDHQLSYVGGGLRLQADFSQRRMGLLEVSARGGFYLAGRAALLTDADRTPMFEGAFGEYIWVGGARLGVEASLAGVSTFDDSGEILPAGTTARLAWNTDGQYLMVNLALTLGFPL